MFPDSALQAAPSNIERVISSGSIMQTSNPNGAAHVLRTARDELARGDLPRALHAYRHLIQRNRLIGDILPDLAQLVKKYPSDPRVWQTLGDALAQAGQSDHAAQSYERAQKLQQQNSSEVSAS